MLTDEQTRHLIALWKHRRSTLEKQATSEHINHHRNVVNHDSLRSLIDELTLVISDIEHEVDRNKRVYLDRRQ